MIRSFRLRLALQSALLTGLVLGAFGLGTWWLIRGMKIDRIDSDVRVHAEREVGRALTVPNWPVLESRIVAALGMRDGNAVVLFAQGAEGETLYRSPRWPENLRPDELPWPKPRSSQAAAVEGLRFSLLSTALAAEANPPLPHPPGRRAEGLDGGAPRGPPNGPRGLREGGPGSDRPPPFDEERFRERRRPLPPPRERMNEERPVAGSQAPQWQSERPASGGVGFAPLAPSPVRSDPPVEPFPARPEALPSVEPPAPPAIPAPAPAPEVYAPPPRPERLPPPVTALHIPDQRGTAWRVGLAATERARVAVAVDARAIDDEMRGIRNAFLLPLPLVLLLIGAVSWLLSGRAMRPVEKLTDTARKVTAEGLDQRISAKGEDREFVELIEVFNGMLERLERSFMQTHRFSADAAHELKTPLAILQGQLERAINASEAGSPMQRQLSGILDEVRRLSTISRKLLLLSQADAGRLALGKTPFDLSSALDDLVEDTRMLAPHLRVEAQIQPGLVVPADGGLLTQVLHNLVSNAIKYNVDKGWIRIATASWPKTVEVVVANASQGIPANERGRIFERFYRADPARGRSVEGVGLGLAVSREIARAHGGDITLKCESDDSVRFTLSLPRAPTDRKPPP